jgi:RimJ/RimL family protein N-acetyltransferase
MKNIPILIGQRVLLTPFTDKDVFTYYNWLKENPDLARKYGEPTDIRMEELISDQQRLSKDEQMIDYLIVDRGKNRAIGEIYLKLPDGTENHNYVRISDGIIIMVRPEFGILLGEKKYSNKNYGAESIKLLFDYAKNAYTLDHIYGRVYTFNIGSQRFLKRLEFENQGLIKDSSNEVCYLFHKMI